MTKKTNTKGFSLPIVLAVVAVIAALLLGGYFVWQRNKDDETANKKTSSSSQSKNQTSDSSKTTDPSEGGKYLVIKEWGVRFELPEVLRGDIYYKVASNDTTKLETASFASNKLDSALGDFSCSFKENPDVDGLSASLVRLSPGNQPAPAYITDRLNSLTKVSGYEYFTPKQASPPITCLTGNREDLNGVEQSISDQLRNAFSGLEVIQQ